MYPNAICNNATIYIKDNQTNQITELGQAESITLNESTKEYDCFSERAKSVRFIDEISVSYKPKKIAKKRFVKLLLSYGIQRNEANVIAKICLRKRGYYSYIDLISLVGRL